MNGIWNGAWRIMRYELRTSWRGFIVTMLMFAYVGICELPLMDAMLSGELNRSMRWAVDFMHFCILPNMGFLLNRSAFRYWRDDPYT